MNEVVHIPLHPTGDVEDFADRERNILQAQVGIGGEWHTSDCIISLALSREAMIALATELLRAAHRPGDAPFIEEILPSVPYSATLTMGVYMHPKSCRLNILEEDFGALGTLLGEKA